MDLVWICRKGPNEELRFSMRSAIQNIQHENVWVVGNKPDWYSGPFIPVFQRNGQKYQNAKNNLIQLISSPEINNDFVLMNDDFFVLKPVKLGYYYSGTLAERIERNARLSPNANYLEKIKLTKAMLEKQGITDPLDYSLHMPMKMDKAGLSISLDYPLIRSGYGNLKQVGGEQRRDVKIYSGTLYNGLSYSPDESSEFISTDDNSFPQVRADLLEKLFPEPTEFERYS
jgi:hypothetical protein